MRRPGNLTGTTYWFAGFGGSSALPPGAINSLLTQINQANIANRTPLNMAQQQQRLADHLKNPRKLSQLSGMDRSCFPCVGCGALRPTDVVACPNCGSNRGWAKCGGRSC